MGSCVVVTVSFKLSETTFLNIHEPYTHRTSLRLPHPRGGGSYAPVAHGTAKGVSLRPKSDHNGPKHSLLDPPIPVREGFRPKSTYFLLHVKEHVYSLAPVPGGGMSTFVG